MSTLAALSITDPKSLINSLGLIGIYLILFAETGLLVGFFLPGDTLLVIAGVASSGAAAKVVGARLPLVALLIGAPLCAIIGAQLGHYLGARFGGGLFNRPDSRLFRREHVDKAEYYFNRFGPAKAVVLARFIPIVRTFLNPVAGLLEMPARSFLLWNVVGAVAWTESVILLGYNLGDSLAPVIDKYMLPVVAFVILIALIPVLVEMLRGRRESSRRGGPSSDGNGRESDRDRSAV